MIHESNLDAFLMENLSCISNQPTKGGGHSDFSNPDFEWQSGQEP